MTAAAPSTASKKAVVLGATGLIGQELLSFLLASQDYQTITTIGRKPTGAHDPRLRELALKDFSKLSRLASSFEQADVFCCLGTTLKKAGSREAFRKIDYDAIVSAAQVSCESQAQAFLLVSSLGADPKSSVFYSRVKGETEEAVKALPFPPAKFIFRPSLLLGIRKESRPFESLAMKALKPLCPLMRGPLAKYRPIAASVVARFMVQSALSARDLSKGPPSRTYESVEMLEN